MFSTHSKMETEYRFHNAISSDELIFITSCQEHVSSIRLSAEAQASALVQLVADKKCLLIFLGQSIVAPENRKAD